MLQECIMRQDGTNTSVCWGICCEIIQFQCDE